MTWGFDRAGPPGTQTGPYLRELYLGFWEMELVARGESEEMIAQARKLDELALPEEDVGLYINLRAAWATKGGGG